MAGISDLQIKLIHCGIAKLSIDDETYRVMLWNHSKVKSCKDMTYQQASSFIDDLVKKGFYIKARRLPRRPQVSNVTYLPSRKQLAMIDRLRRQIRWKYSDGYHGFVAKMFKRTYLRTGKEGQMLIEALKGVLKNQASGYETSGDRVPVNESSGT